MKKYILRIGILPSVCHSRFDDKESAQKEADRINALIIKRNEQIDRNPATGRGAVFSNMKRVPNWNVFEIEVPDA